MGRTVGTTKKHVGFRQRRWSLFANPFGGYSIRKTITRHSSRSLGTAANSGRFESYVTQHGAV